MRVLTLTKQDKILIIAPHPDDECIGTGGILCLYPEICDIVVLTDGAVGQGDIKLDECRKIRREEFRQEMQCLGIDRYRFLDFPDGNLMQYIDCLNNYDLSPYTKIFVTGSRDNHADHTAAYLCLIHALQFQGVSDVEVYLYEVHNPLEDVSHYLDITDCIDKKLELIRKHVSQLVTVPYDRYALISSEYRALQNRMNGHYIEVYSLIQPDAIIDQQRVSLENELQKFKQFYRTLTKWMYLSSFIDIADILLDMGITSYAIYGYAELGKILRKKMDESRHSIELLYVLDKKIDQDPDGNLNFYYPGNEPFKAEIIIVTAIYYYEEIENELQAYGYKSIISLEKLIDRI